MYVCMSVCVCVHACVCVCACICQPPHKDSAIWYCVSIDPLGTLPFTVQYIGVVMNKKALLDSLNNKDIFNPLQSPG